MRLRIVLTMVVGLGLSTAIQAQSTAQIYPVELEIKGSLEAASTQSRAHGAKAHALALGAEDLVRRAGFNPRFHRLAVVGAADSMDVVVWDTRQRKNAPGTAAATIGSLTLNGRLNQSRASRPRTIDLVSTSLNLGATAHNQSFTMGSTSVGRWVANSAGALRLTPATEDGTGSLGTIELCSESACARGYLTTVDIRVGFGKSIGRIQTPVIDSDGDGYADNVDQCPAAGDEGYGVDAVGCPIPGSRDSDGDGIIDSQDACPGQGDAGYGVDSNGCPNIDSDGDGIPDAIDFCPDRGEEGYGVDGNGCPNPPAPQDFDGDGVTDDVDQCFSEGNTYGYGVYPNGCPIMDSDGDGYADPYDSCPFEGDLGNGIDGTGCPVPDGVQRSAVSKKKPRK